MARQVTIAGCGLIGQGWAAAFLRAGWRVVLWDQSQDALDGARHAIGQSVRDMIDVGMMQPGAPVDIDAMVDLKAAVDGSAYIQESVPENAAIKTAVTRDLDRAAAPEALIGSSTSTFVGSLFLADIAGRDRCMVAHPANPPHLMPVVELVPSDWHDTTVVQRFSEVMIGIGQKPVILRKEIEGFVMNRLQTAVICEAISLVTRGVIDPAGLDDVMKHSLGLRWAFMGPFETMDLNAPGGFLDYATRYGDNYRDMARDLNIEDPWPPETLQEIENACRANKPGRSIADGMKERNHALLHLLALRERLKTG